MDENGIELSNLNQPQQAIPQNATPNVAIAFVNDIEGLASEIEKKLEVLNLMENKTSTQAIELGVIVMKMHHLTTVEIPNLRGAFE